MMLVCLSDRGKGRQRQAILGEHPSSFSENGYGKTLSDLRGETWHSPPYTATSQ